MCNRINALGYDLTPPLRLVLNTNCNGRCSFCHREGSEHQGSMESSLVYECAEVAERIKIPHVALTGGEPTLRADLADLIEGIQARYSGNVSLTTNGVQLQDLSKQIKIPLHTVNLSIVSFEERIYSKYQNVDPFNAIESLLSFPAKNRNLNVVVVEDTIESIVRIAEYSIEHALSMHIMFELRKISPTEEKTYSEIIKKLCNLGHCEMRYGSTPSLVVKTMKQSEIIIKYPKLSESIKWEVCEVCKNGDSCYEKVCAVRVYPGGLVSPCLNGQISYQSGSIAERITQAYDLFTPQKLVSFMQYHQILQSLKIFDKFLDSPYVK